ncbi:MAG: hypothetical protein WC532_03900 [Candidatus Omnitrophota bacterium]
MKPFIISCLVVLSFLRIPAFAGEEDKLNKAWQHIAVNRLFSQQLSSEEAIVWHLDYNGFAALVPGCLMIFDYDNETPAPQNDKKSETGIVESLLTGVINPEEIKDQPVIFFFSHEHPAEKLIKLLKWKDAIKDVLFVLPEGIYLKYEEQIKELKQADSADLNKKDVFSVIKRVLPNHTYVVKGNTISVLEQQAPHPGVEFIVETANGLTIYHSGSLLCRHCPDVENERIALAVYSDLRSPAGNIFLAGNCAIPEYDIGIIGVSGFKPGGFEAEIAGRIKEKNYLLEKDKFFTERNPYFWADLGNLLWVEHETSAINDYFKKIKGNPDILKDIKNAVVRRYAEYMDDVRQYCSLETTPDECDEKISYRKYGGIFYTFSSDVPSFARGECFLFSAGHKPAGGEYFSGYWSSEGWPLFPPNSILWDIFQEHGIKDVGDNEN